MAHREQFSIDEHVFMVVNYIRCGSPEQTRRAFAVTYPQKRVPSKSTIQRNVTKYLTYEEYCNSKRIFLMNIASKF